MFAVAPRRGAWIEIPLKKKGDYYVLVAPRRGAWIEIQLQSVYPHDPLGRPSQRGVD